MLVFSSLFSFNIFAMGAKAPLETGLKRHSTNKSKEAGFHNFVKNQIIDEEGMSLCGNDLYKDNKDEISPLMAEVMESVDKVSEKATMDSKYLWTTGYGDRKVLRGGNAIFNKMADLIINAESEVLIQTFILNFNGAGTKIIYDAIVKLEAKRKVMNADRPIVVRFLFDIIGSYKGANLFELMGALRNGGRKRGSLFKDGKENGDYQIEFPKKLDPKYVRFEIKAHRHSSLRAVNHSKSIVVDRNKSIVMGANFVGYHHSDELIGKEELMVDHGFLLMGEVTRGLANDFYNLWHKNDGKEDGISSEYNGNVPADELYSYHDEKLGSTEITSWMKTFSKTKLEGPYTMGIVGKKAFGATRVKTNGENPQNAAFVAALKNAKSHINITSPNLNSKVFMQEMVNAIARNVDINFLISKNYQNYNGPLQEGGTNADAVEWILTQRKELIKKQGEDSVGMFNLRYFVTRGGNLSGKKTGQRYRSSSIITEKFYNHNHTKFFSADNQVAIVGSANMDEQSFYNSRELNVVFDGHILAKKWCQDVFKTDFLRAKRYGDKKWLGEKCYRNNDCKSNRCWNRVGKSWKCIAKKREGLSGGFCDENSQCKSNVCLSSVNLCK